MQTSRRLSAGTLKLQLFYIMDAKAQTRLKRLQTMPTTEERKVEGRTPVTYQVLTSLLAGSGKEDWRSKGAAAGRPSTTLA